MSHGPSTDWGQDNATAYKTRIGLWMFAFYCLVYAAFIIINILNPKIMATVFLGQNLAIWYGFGLIVLALILAVVYTILCNRAERRLNAMASADEGVQI
ncbi:MAG: DUF485 domain-containing protein [Bacillota bacterium]